VNALAKVTKWLSKFFVMMLLMLLAQGRGISWSMKQGDITWLSTILVPLVACSACLETFGEFAESRKYTTGFIYDTNFGLVLIAIDIIIFVIFLTKLHMTISTEGDKMKKLFYYVLGLMATAWFLTLPVLGILGWAIAPWVRTEILQTVSWGSHTVANVVLVVFFMQGQSSYVDVSFKDGELVPEVLGQGILKLTTGPLPEQPKELTGSELQLLPQN